MATGGTGAGLEPLPDLAHGPGAGPGPGAGAGCRGGDVGGGWGSRPRARTRGRPLAHVKLGAKAPKGSGSALEPPVAMYFHKKGIEITYIITRI